MTRSRSKLLLAALATALLTSIAAAPVGAEDPAAALKRDAAPGNGDINLGGDPLLPSAAIARKIPSQEEARAALMMPDPGTSSAGEAAPSPPATIGAAPAAPVTSGPIGATLQTMPAKFSRRNDVLDRLPTMAWPLPLSDQQRQQIYQAVMAEKTQAAAEADALAPASALSFAQTEEMHPLPEALRQIPGLQNLSYVKAKGKILLVRPNTAIVVDEITAS